MIGQRVRVRRSEAALHINEWGTVTDVHEGRPRYVEVELDRKVPPGDTTRVVIMPEIRFNLHFRKV